MALARRAPGTQIARNTGIQAAAAAATVAHMCAPMLCCAVRFVHTPRGRARWSARLGDDDDDADAAAADADDIGDGDDHDAYVEYIIYHCSSTLPHARTHTHNAYEYSRHECVFNNVVKWSVECRLGVWARGWAVGSYGVSLLAVRCLQQIYAHTRAHARTHTWHTAGGVALL